MFENIIDLLVKYTVMEGVKGSIKLAVEGRETLTPAPICKLDMYQWVARLSVSTPFDEPRFQNPPNLWVLMSPGLDILKIF